MARSTFAGFVPAPVIEFWWLRGFDELKKAEQSEVVDMAQFAKRLRDQFNVPLENPKENK